MGLYVQGKIWLLNKEASRTKAKSAEFISKLKIKPGYVIADIGVGGGYFSNEFSKLVGSKGHVYAIDTHAGLVRELARRRSPKQKNLTYVHVEPDHVMLPKKVDLIFMRNVYHHIHNRIGYFKQLQHILAPKGRVAIIDFKSGGFFQGLKFFGHSTSPDTIRSELAAAGYKSLEEQDIRKDQSFMVFGR